MPGDSPLPLATALLLAIGGVGALALLWRCWSGRWRTWARHPFSRQVVLAWGPFAGLALLATGVWGLAGEPVGALVAAVLYLAGLATLVPGLLYLLFAPRWWGPGWFRRLRRVHRLAELADPHIDLADRSDR